MITKHGSLSLVLACLVGIVGCKTGAQNSASDIASHKGSDKIKNMYGDAAMTSDSKSEFGIKSDWDEVHISKDGFTLRQGNKDYQTGQWDEVTNPADSVSMQRLQTAIAAVQVVNERLAGFDNKDIQNMKPSAKALLGLLQRMASAKDATAADKDDLDSDLKDLFKDLKSVF